MASFPKVWLKALAARGGFLGKALLPTPIEIDRRVADADLVIGLGQITPHYFAGFSGGGKCILPGVASLRSIRLNHAMKSHPAARLGVVDGNPVREEIEQAAQLLPSLFILNAVLDDRGRPCAIFAGHPIKAHRRGAEFATRAFAITRRRFDIVLSAGGGSLSRNVYQMAKSVAPAATFVKPGGSIISVGECPEGLGGTPEVINETIFRAGLRDQLPPNVDISLVCGLPRNEVAETFFRPVPSVQQAYDQAIVRAGGGARVCVLTDAGTTIPIDGDD